MVIPLFFLGSIRLIDVTDTTNQIQWVFSNAFDLILSSEYISDGSLKALPKSLAPSNLIRYGELDVFNFQAEEVCDSIEWSSDQNMIQNSNPPIQIQSQTDLHGREHFNGIRYII